eukprot:5537249-Amphidinium_carterae.1
MTALICSWQLLPHNRISRQDRDRVIDILLLLGLPEPVRGIRSVEEGLCETQHLCIPAAAQDRGPQREPCAVR